MNAQTKPIHTIIDQNVVNIFTIIFANINIGRSNYPLKQNQGSWDLLGPVKLFQFQEGKSWTEEN